MLEYNTGDQFQDVVVRTRDPRQEIQPIEPSEQEGVLNIGHDDHTGGIDDEISGKDSISSESCAAAPLV